MIDEHHEELASLYVLGLLEGAELAAFESRLANEPALAALVRELNEASAQLAYTAPDAAPPPELRARLLNQLETADKWRAQSKVIPFRSWFPLAAAAVLKGDDAWAARIQGARDAVTERTGATVVDRSVHDLRDQAERAVRSRLGPKRWAKAYAAGRGASIDSLIKDIDRIG